jgi:hypothetical protein
MAQMIEHMANDELVGWGLGTERWPRAGAGAGARRRNSAS